MLRRTILFFALVLVALLAGRAFWVWIAENPIDIPEATYVAFFQALDRAIENPIRFVAAGALVLSGISAILARHDRPVFYLWLATFSCVLASSLITILVHVPINHQLAGFSPAALPPCWPELRDRWWEWHKLRMLALVAGMSFAFLAAMREAPAPTEA
jgi:uncharacterized membrane protein